MFKEILLSSFNPLQWTVSVTTQSLAPWEAFPQVIEVLEWSTPRVSILLQTMADIIQFVMQICRQTHSEFTKWQLSLPFLSSEEYHWWSLHRFGPLKTDCWVFFSKAAKKSAKKGTQKKLNPTNVKQPLLGYLEKLTTYLSSWSRQLSCCMLCKAKQ